MSKLTGWDKFRYGLEFYGLLVAVNLVVHAINIKEDINDVMTPGLTREERNYFFERTDYEFQKITDLKILIPGSPWVPWFNKEYKPFMYERTKKKLRVISKEERLEKYLQERAKRKQKILRWV
jgi:hypothetical protein